MMRDTYWQWRARIDETWRTDLQLLRELLENWEKLYPFPTDWDEVTANRMWEESQPLDWDDYRVEVDRGSNWDEEAQRLQDHLKGILWLTAWNRLAWATTGMGWQEWTQDGCWDSTVETFEQPIFSEELKDLDWKSLLQRAAAQDLMEAAALHREHSFHLNLVWFLCWWTGVDPRAVDWGIPEHPSMPAGLKSVPAPLWALSPTSPDQPPVPRAPWMGAVLNMVNEYYTGEPIKDEESWTPQATTLEEWEEEIGDFVCPQVTEIMKPLFTTPTTVH